MKEKINKSKCQKKKKKSKGNEQVQGNEDKLEKSRKKTKMAGK